MRYPTIALRCGYIVVCLPSYCHLIVHRPHYAGIAVITTFAYALGYYLLVTEGRKAYFTFVPMNDVTLGLEEQQEGGGVLRLCVCERERERERDIESEFK